MIGVNLNPCEALILKLILLQVNKKNYNKIRGNLSYNNEIFKMGFQLGTFSLYNIFDVTPRLDRAFILLFASIIYDLLITISIKKISQ